MEGLLHSCCLMSISIVKSSRRFTTAYRVLRWTPSTFDTWHRLNGNQDCGSLAPAFLPTLSLSRVRCCHWGTGI